MRPENLGPSGNLMTHCSGLIEYLTLCKFINQRYESLNCKHTNSVIFTSKSLFLRILLLMYIISIFCCVLCRCDVFVPAIKINKTKWYVCFRYLFCFHNVFTFYHIYFKYKCTVIFLFLLVNKFKVFWIIDWFFCV